MPLSEIDGQRDCGIEGLWLKECRPWHCHIVIPKETLMGFFFSAHQSFSNYLSCLAEIYHNRHLGNWWHPPLGLGLLFDLCRCGNLGFTERAACNDPKCFL